MAVVLKDGNTVNGYTIKGSKLLSGAFTMCYKAQRDGIDVFFKQYKSPSVRTSWYKGYRDYIRQIRNQIESGPCKYSTYQILDQFEEKNTLYQVFEFVPDGKDLFDFLSDHTEDKPGHCPEWNKRIIFAKLLMDCIKKFHAAKIIHCDLKPKNIVLIEDKTIGTGYQFKLADMDFSILSEQRAPWESEIGFVGSPGYMSPEHLRGEIPLFVSDVFTCGIMLYEILCNDYPYADADEHQDYARKVFAGEFKEPVLLCEFPGQKQDEVKRIMTACLNPDKTKRPTAEEVHKVLLGSRSFGAISLTTVLGSLNANIETVIGNRALRSIGGEDAQFASSNQFTLFKEKDGWYVLPNVSAVNDTLLNGRKIVSQMKLEPNDVLAIGKEAKGIVKLPMKISY